MQMKLDIPEIVVIDDAPNAAQDFADLIEAQTGLKTKAFSNPSDLLDYISHANVKIAILDQVMPDIKGTDLFEKINQIDPNIQAIMLTGEASREDLSYAINLGFSKFLNKNEISKLSGIVLELYTSYEVKISKDLKLNKPTALFPRWKKLFSPCYLISCIPHGGHIIADEGEIVLDIYAGEEKEWNSTINIENNVQIESKKLFKFDSIKFLWQPNQSFLQRPLLILHNCVKGDGTSQAMRKFSRPPI